MPDAPSSASLPRSLADSLTAHIRSLIITGDLAPGQPIRVRELKERFSVSHIPIREALRTLEGEGLVRYVAQRGAIATEVSVDELREIYELRRVIECRAAELSAPSYDATQLDRLADAAQAMESARGAGPHSEAFFQAHHEFHLLLLQPFASAYTQRVVQTLWQASRRYVHLFIASRPESRGRHHRAILEAARSRDADGIRKLLDEHLRFTENSLVPALPATAVDTVDTMVSEAG